MKIDIILCTYNPRMDYLERTMESIECQLFQGEGIEVQFSLVDNNSAADAAKKLKEVCASRQIHCLHETEQGLVHARICGLRNTQGELVVWVDDDTVLDANFIQHALEIYRTKPFLGAWGGNVHLELEKPVRPEIRPYLALLTENTVEIEEWSNFQNCTPVAGAGLCVRREVGDRYVQNYEASPMRKLLGRSAQNLFSGEDWDFCLTAAEMGLGVGRMPQLSLTHLIPERRTTEEYLLKIAEGHKFSAQIVLAIRQRPLIRENFRGKILGLQLRGVIKPSFAKRILIAELRGLEKGLEFVRKHFTGLTSTEKS